jgi:hypothetical protein
MAFRPLKSLFATAEDLVAADLPRLGEALLIHLKSYEGESGNSVYQRGMICQSNFRGMLERQTGTGPLRREQDYEDKQPKVIQALMEAWDWLQREGILIREASQPAPWFVISRKGEELLSRANRLERLEGLGVDHVKQAVVKGFFSTEEADEALEWLRIKAGQAALPPRKRTISGNVSTFIAESRIEELRKLSSPDFDFQKLVRLCDELNSSYESGNYYATAMLTRGVLDHVPPIFGHSTFSEVANNYRGGSKSFKDAMQHLGGAARKVSDGHLHTQIRKSETLPTPQQVYFGPQLDLLLAEIVRIMK